MQRDDIFTPVLVSLVQRHVLAAKSRASHVALGHVVVGFATDPQSQQIYQAISQRELTLEVAARILAFVRQCGSNVVAYPLDMLAEASRQLKFRAVLATVRLARVVKTCIVKCTRDAAPPTPNVIHVRIVRHASPFGMIARSNWDWLVTGAIQLHVLRLHA